MRLAAVLLSGSIVAVAACADDPAAGEPLIESTLIGDFKGQAFTPAFGFARDEEDVLELFVGTRPISCADSFTGAPRPGTYVATGVESPAVGAFGSRLFNFVHVTDDGELSGGGSNTGSIELAALSDVEVTATLSYDFTTSAGDHHALTGTVTLVRCP